MPDFNSREYEYADVSASLFGVNLSGLRGLTYKKTQEKEPVYGQGNEPKAIQRGNKKYEGQLMLLKSEFDQILTAAQAKGFADLIDIPGNLIFITCVYKKTESAFLQVVKITNVDFTEYEDGMKQGDKFKEITLPFLFTKLDIKNL